MATEMNDWSLKQRAALSATSLLVVSVVTKLWSTSITDQTKTVVELLELAETSKAKATTEENTNHIAFALGLCTAARTILKDSDIERSTGIHMQSYEEELNALLRQYARSRRERRRRTEKRL